MSLQSVTVTIYFDAPVTLGLASGMMPPNELLHPSDVSPSFFGQFLLSGLIMCPR